MSSLVYIYNMLQAAFYIENGLIPKEKGIAKRGDTFFAFDRNEAAPLFKIWCDNCREYTSQLNK